MDKKVTSIGGQALMEGVMMRGPTSMAMAVRNKDGFIEVDSVRLKPIRWYNKVPVLRGVVSFVESLYNGVNTITKSAQVVGDEDEKISNGGMIFAVCAGVLLAIGLFMLVPELIASLIDGLIGHSVLIKSLIAGALRMIIFVAYLLIVSRMKDIRRTFMYHGAEHRTINCYESGMELTVENVQKCSTRHNRCGTTFLFIVMVVSILLFAIVNWILDLLIGDMLSGFVKKLVYFGIKLVILPFTAGISYEILKGVAKLPNNIFAKILRAPGLALQGLTTKIPDDDMAEVAIKSFLTVLKMEENSAEPTRAFGNLELPDVRKYIIKRIGKEEVEADWILCDTLKCKRGDVPLIKYVSLADFGKIKSICDRRVSGEPLDYILGKSYFYGLEIKVNDSVLIPRMETELLVSEAISAISDRYSSCVVLDLCTGSGCIAKALAVNTSATVVASDISDDALKVADENLEGTSVTLIKSDLFDAFNPNSFDVIVSNPPYIRSGDINSLSAEVKHEPRIALDGGESGLDFYKRIVCSAPIYLKKGGCLLLEIGYDQAEPITRLMETFGFSGVKTLKDYDGNDRIVIGKV